MLKIVLGTIAGFIIWTILWVGSDAVFMAFSNFYREYMQGFQKALETKESFEISSTILLLTLFKSFLCSLVSGFTAASIAGENRISPLFTGILLLVFGIFIQSVYWNYIPLWYHLSFLVLLIPMTIFGGKLRKQRRRIQPRLSNFR